MSEIKIRLVREDEVPQLIELCKEHARFEKVDYSSEGKEQKLREHIFHVETNIKFLVVEQNLKLLGYSTIVKQFSTWDASYYYYMDCLYLKEEARGKGLGKLMMEKIKNYALKENCDLQWQTPKFNKSAIQFYNALGAESKSKKRFFWTVT